MSLLPYWLDNTSHLLDQHFGLGMDLEDLMTSMAVSPFCSMNYFRPWRSLVRSTSHADAGSKITVDKDKFQIALDVQQFKPEEITVKTAGQQVVVEGKHEEKQDEHGYISRHFVRKYQLPEDCKIEEVSSTLSSDGVLSITAPRPRRAIEEKERVVPVTATGPVHKSVQDKTGEDQKMEA